MNELEKLVRRLWPMSEKFFSNSELDVCFVLPNSFYKILYLNVGINNQYSITPFLITDEKVFEGIKQSWRT